LVLPNLAIFIDGQSSRASPPIVEVSGNLYTYPFQKVSSIFHIEGNTTDPDGNDDIARMSIRITPDPLPEFTQFDGAAKWHYDWDTNEVPDGTYCIWIRAEDKEGMGGVAIFNVSVANHPDYNKELPIATIDDPGGSLSGIAQVTGTASVKGGTITKVEVRIDNGPWTNPVGISPWTYSIDTLAYSEGSHMVYARCHDGTTYSHSTNRVVLISNHGSSVPRTQWGGDFSIVTPGEGVPRFVDFNGDGLYDILSGTNLDTPSGVSNSLDLRSAPRALYLNIGDKNHPYFKMMNVNLPYKYQAPIGDITDFDGDGNFDLFLTTRYYVMYYRNIGDAVRPNFTTTVVPSGYDPDASANRFGTIRINEGQGFGEPLIKGFDLRDSGFDLGDINGDGTKDFIYASPPGKLGCYLNLGNRTNISWVKNDTIMSSIDVGDWYINPSLVDINGDGKLDLVIVSYTDWDKSYNLSLYENVGSLNTPEWKRNDAWANGMPRQKMNIFDFADLDGDGDLDLLASGLFRPARLYWNIGSRTSPVWRVGAISLDGQIYGASPLLVDYDRDGDLDLFTYDNWTYDDPGLRYFRNVGGPKTPRFEENKTVVATLPNLTKMANMNFADLDGDGRLELILLRYGGTNYPPEVFHLEYYFNNGNDTSPHWVIKDSVLPNSLQVATRPFFKDLDGDGDLDLVYSCSVVCYRLNEGDKKTPTWGEEKSTGYTDWNYNGGIFPLDLNKDGRSEIVVSTYSHGMQYYDLVLGVSPALVRHEEVFNSIRFSTYYDFGDLDGDGLLDVLAFDLNSNTMYFRNLSDTYTGLRVNGKKPVTEVNMPILFDAARLGNITNITSFKWDFGDGQVTDFSTDSTISHTYRSVGTYNVRLEMKNGNDTVTSIEGIHISVISYPNIPYLDIKWPGWGLYVKRGPASFDASRSFDPGGFNLTFAWKFEGMNQITGSKSKITFDKPGSYNASLTVTNEKGRSQQVNFTVIVGGEPWIEDGGIWDPRNVMEDCLIFLAVLVIIFGAIYIIMIGKKRTPYPPKKGTRKIKQKKSNYNSPRPPAQ